MLHPEHTENTGHLNLNPHDGKRCVLKAAVAVCCLCAGIAAHAQQAQNAQNAQQAPAEAWTLKQCLDYAHANSLQLKQADLRIRESECSRTQRIASLFPAVNASTSFGLSRQNVRNSMNEYMSDNTVNARYSIGASMTVFNGLRQYRGLQQQELDTRMKELDKEEQRFRLDLAIIRAYTQIAYLRENIAVLEGCVTASEARLALAEHRLKAGSVSVSDCAQLAARCSTDRYNLVCGRNRLEEQLLELKQLLELDMDCSLQTVPYAVDTLRILEPLPDKKEICEAALLQLPECRSREISLRMAELDCKMAGAGYSPSLTLAASIGTGHWFDGAESFVTQLNDNLNQSLGLSLNVPVFNGLQTRTAVQKARLNRQNAELERRSAEKEVLSTIEALYSDALAAQSQYVQARAQLEAAAAGHRLAEEQFRLGLKNTAELLMSNSSLQEASQNLLQAKYTADLALRLLQYYRGIPAE